MNREFPNNNNPKNQTENEDVDVKKLLNVIFRNKILISSFTIFFLIFSSLYSISKKRIWEGQFQIVVKEKTENQSSSISRSMLSASNMPSIGNLNLGIGLGSSLKTQVGILESPSVLMPVFEFFSQEKSKRNPKNDKQSFGSWKKNLNVELKKNTSILDIYFQDNNKELIIDVLNKISNTYQVYSGKGKKRDLDLAKIYLDKQISFYKDKSYQSMSKVQEYAMDQDLSVVDYSSKGPTSLDSFFPQFANPLGSTLNNKTAIGENISIEVARVSAANLIRNIESKIRKIESMKDSINDITYITMTIPELIDSPTMASLNQVNLQILDIKTKYTDKYPEIKKLKEKKLYLINLLKEQSIGYLKSAKLSAESVLESTTRPKEVLLKYKQFIREANRDESTLIALENQLRSIRLQQAKLEDPWELITEPTINPKAVAPNRLIITLFGTILGFILGYIFAVFKERKGGLIYEEDTLESLLKTKIIEKIDLNNLDSEIFINEVINQNKDNCYKLYYSEHLQNLDPESLRSLFENKENNSFIVSDFINIKENEIIIFVTTIPDITYKEVMKIKNQIDLLDKKLLGILLVNL